MAALNRPVSRWFEAAQLLIIHSFDFVQDQPICQTQQVRMGERPLLGPLPTCNLTGAFYYWPAGRIPPTHSPVSGEGYPLITRFQVAHQLTGMFHGLSAEGHPSQ
jgi:hypothetical protein